MTPKIKVEVLLEGIDDIIKVADKIQTNGGSDGFILGATIAALGFLKRKVEGENDSG